MNIDALKVFVLDAQKQYGSGDIELDRHADGRKVLVTDGELFTSTDEFDGGNPYCGIVRVIDKKTNHCIWNSYYHGWITQPVTETDIRLIFDFLREALQKPDKQTIQRGPAEYKNAKFTYKNTLDYGNFDCFYGSEAIYDNQNNQVYYGRYGGGLVDLVEDTGEA